MAEITENYWMALARDIPFSAYGSHPLIGDAIADFEKTLSSGSSLRQELFYRDAAASIEALTAQTLFRGVFPGERVGPHISQFLLQDCFLGSLQIDQRMWTVMPGIDYMTTFSKWLDVQRGVKQAADVHDPQVRYMRNGRDLGQWVHVDQLYQAYLMAALQLLDGGAELGDSNPYNMSANQQGFATFGGPKVLSLVTEVATRALKAVWYQKWAVHRRLRPEAFAGRIHAKYIGGADGVAVAGLDINSAIEEASVLSRVYGAHGSLLLPMAFPEGSPMHPAYGAGHATVAGACTTILKALFKGANKFSSLRHPRTKASLVPVEAAPNGLSRQNYTGADADDLTITGELNKLAGNIAIGRNFAGVHWRSDYRESMLLGEKVAIGTLMDYVGSFNEQNASFEFQSFTGHAVTVRDHEVEIDGTQVIQRINSYNAELIGLEQ
ncbi:MAG: vanadium-dependent haloperoxidase [Caldilineaceae bacterium]